MLVEKTQKEISRAVGTDLTNRHLTPMGFLSNERAHFANEIYLRR